MLFFFFFSLALLPLSWIILKAIRTCINTQEGRPIYTAPCIVEQRGVRAALYRWACLPASSRLKKRPSRGYRKLWKSPHLFSLFRGLYCSSWRRRVVDKKQLGQKLHTVCAPHPKQLGLCVRRCYEVSGRDSTPSSFSLPPSSVIDVCLSVCVSVCVIVSVWERRISRVARSHHPLSLRKKKKKTKTLPSQRKFIPFFCVCSFVLSARTQLIICCVSWFTTDIPIFSPPPLLLTDVVRI